MSFRFGVIAVGLGLGALGCSPEAKVESALEDYKTVFQMCKDMTVESGMSPGEHTCAAVSSMALDMAMQDTGMEETAWRAKVEEWAQQNEFTEYYLPPGDPRRES